GREVSGIGLGGVTPAAERYGLERIRVQEDRIVPGLAVEGGSPFGSDARVTALASEVFGGGIERSGANLRSRAGERGRCVPARGDGGREEGNRQQMRSAKREAHRGQGTMVGEDWLSPRRAGVGRPSGGDDRRARGALAPRSRPPSWPGIPKGHRASGPQS